MQSKAGPESRVAILNVGIGVGISLNGKVASEQTGVD